MSSNFQIGLYVPQGTSATSTTPIVVTQNPFMLNWGTGPFQLVYYDVRPPRNVQHTTPGLLGQDSQGAPSVRGYGQMQWSYPIIRADNWYFIYYLWRLAQMAKGQYAGHVRVKWPDPQSGTIQTASCRWPSIPQVSRDVAVFNDLQLTFTHLGIDDLNPVTGVYTVR